MAKDVTDQLCVHGVFLGDICSQCQARELAYRARQTDAEKYAKVFRAAADGIALSYLAPHEREYRDAHPDEQSVESLYDSASQRAMVGWGMAPGSPHSGSTPKIGMMWGYHGIASMFEKIAAAERA